MKPMTLVQALEQIARLAVEGEVSARMQYALSDIATAALRDAALSQQNVWIVRATMPDRYDDAESNVLLEMAYDNREDAHAVYAHGESACADRPYVRWTLEHIRIEDHQFGVEYGKHCVDTFMHDLLDDESEND